MENLRKNESLAILVAFFFIISTFWISQENYLLFHGLVEGLSIFISFTVFVIAWNSRAYMKDSYLLIIGFAYLFIGFLDYLHTLSYVGMGVFTSYRFYANQLWIGTRFFESAILLLALLILGKKMAVKPLFLLLSYGGLTLMLISSIFFSDLFPICYLEGVGQTSFKIASEYVIVGILILSLLILIKKRQLFDQQIARYIGLSILMTILSEISFVFYIDNYGFSNILGHYFKIISFYYIYRAIVVTGIKQPYNLVFKELSDANYEMNKLNAQLITSIDESEKAIQSKNKYLSVLSHEMRTPLNGILGFAQLLKRTHLTEEQEEYLAEITRSSENLRLSIDNILDMEKLKSNKMIFSRKKIDLADFFNDRILFYETLCRDKGLEFNYSIDINDQVRVHMDPEKIEQVLNNLISNGVKFTNEGRVSLEVSSSLYPEDLVLMLKVTDTGIGISADEKKTIFEPFTQVGDAIRSKYGGSGLGLSICKEIADHYQGQITVDSEVGRGSTFSLLLHLDPVE